MLATLTEDRFSDEGWIYERKLDGVRAIVVRNDSRVELFSRNHKSMNASYPELVEAFAAQPVQQFVVDGEIVAFDGEQTSFEKLQARIHQTHPDKIRASGVEVFIYLFDLLDVDDKDITGFPLTDRKQLLSETIDFAGPVRYSEHRNTHGEAYYAEACANGWEGIIAKRANSRYRVGHRSPDWLKFKCVKDQEMVVGGFTDPRGTRIGFGALLVGYYDGKQLRYAGKVGTGYNQSLLRSLRSQLDGLEQDQSPFAEPVRERGAHWVRPDLVAQVGFSEWTDDGKLRHPRFQGLRTDKAATEVVREAR
jgi:bifunctional non-homologous end joining protein LigD